MKILNYEGQLLKLDWTIARGLSTINFKNNKNGMQNLKKINATCIGVSISGLWCSIHLRK
jgi:hypothetical protein